MEDTCDKDLVLTLGYAGKSPAAAGGSFQPSLLTLGRQSSSSSAHSILSCHTNLKREGDDRDGRGGSGKKLRLSKEQSALLEGMFKEQSTLNPKQKVALAKQLNLRPRQVEVWFQNRRARTKLKQTEVDCELLRKYCDMLAEENRRLKVELQELKAPALIYAQQLPAAAVCASCQKIRGDPKAAAS